MADYGQERDGRCMIQLVLRLRSFSRTSFFFGYKVHEDKTGSRREFAKEDTGQR